MKTKSWKNIKDSVYGKKGTERRDKLDREFESFKAEIAIQGIKICYNKIKR